MSVSLITDRFEKLCNSGKKPSYQKCQWLIESYVIDDRDEEIEITTVFKTEEPVSTQAEEVMRFIGPSNY